MNITEFSLTLYFQNKPDIAADALMAAWGREGYGCEPKEDQEGAIFAGFRGATFVNLDPAAEMNKAEFPEIYDQMAKPDLNYDQTYLIDPKKAFQDFQKCKYQMELLFRCEENLEEPTMAHNELNAVLLGIRQVYPIDAVWMHQLGILVGTSDLNEFTSYAQTDEDLPPPQFAPSMAFGTLFGKSETGMVKAWTTGLEHFQSENFYVEAKNMDLMMALKVIFNAGYAVTSGRTFNIGETAQIGETPCRIEAGELDGEPALKLTSAE